MLFFFYQGLNRACFHKLVHVNKLSMCFLLKLKPNVFILR